MFTRSFIALLLMSTFLVLGNPVLARPTVSSTNLNVHARMMEGLVAKSEDVGGDKTLSELLRSIPDDVDWFVEDIPRKQEESKPEHLLVKKEEEELDEDALDFILSNHEEENNPLDF
ncbi:hypothetical protein FRC02_011598 [Tulasnella sp. 418]|nr:hypothetical protein FRC02_011598 [Tulasnella sp. 418]